MTAAEFRELCGAQVQWLRNFAPKDTGNLAYNGIKVKYPSANVCEIYIDENIAPYMPFTELPWISPKWNGKTNPNENWFENSAKLIYLMLKMELEGVRYLDYGNEEDNKMGEELAAWQPGYRQWQRTKKR